MEKGKTAIDNYRKATTSDKSIDLIMAMRCTTVKYAREFIDKGQVKLNTPRDWEKYISEGRGDAYEGTKAFCSMYDIPQLKALNSKYPDAERDPYESRILFKSIRSMNLPCLCMYALDSQAFTSSNCEDKRKVRHTIPASYFDDFVDHKSLAEVESLPEEDKPALYVIHDFGSFLQRLTEKLTALGCREDEILVNEIKYEDFEQYGENGWMDFERSEPNELFVKNKRFEIHREIRMVINTDDSNILNALKNPIELGNMQDIAKISEKFYQNGLMVELTV